MKTLKDFEKAIIDSRIPDSPVENIIDTEKSAAKVFELAKQMQESKWIPVTERLPETQGYYLVVVDEQVASKRQGVVEISECYETVKDMHPVLKFHSYITHWQPLPAPPKI